jgi:signal transduction histidine kinase
MLMPKLNLSSLWPRILLVALSILASIIFVLHFYPTAGTAVSAVILLPVVTVSWSYGLRVGLLTGLVLVVITIALLSWLATAPLVNVFQRDAWSYVAIIAVSGVVGRLHDVGEQLNQERNRRLQAEATLQETESRIRTLVEQSPFSTQIFRPDGSVITINQAFCTLWNVSPADARHIVDHYNILKDEQLAKGGLMPYIRQGFTEKFAEIPEIEYDPQKTDMVRDTRLKPKWVLGYIWPVKDERGRVQQVVLMHQDITERKQVEAQQLELALTRERADVLNELLNTLSHDLKTPLSIINTSLYLLEKITDPAYQKRKIENIKEQVSHLDRMIQNILTISYLETASASTMQPLDVHAVASQVRDMLQPVAEARSIALELGDESALPPLRANAIELRRMMVNLVENALHYTPSGGRVKLQTSARENQVVVEIFDTGIGIQAADLAHIFEPFYRTDKARATDNGGTGLGLSIAKKIAERHQGRIEVESAPGQGSTFRVWLPADPNGQLPD